MQKVLALWAVPRSRSSAFTWMMKNRGDFVVLLEPFGKSAYYSEDRIIHRYTNIIEPNPEYNYELVLKKIISKSKKERLFVKDFPYYFVHIVDRTFLSLFQHTFLIRDPAEMLPSYINKMPDVTFEEIGYEQLYQFFERVASFTGEIPPLIDADDLVNHPTSTVRLYCEKVGIPFMPEALSWEPETDKIQELSWTEGHWLDTLSVSRGFQKKTNHNYLNVNDSDRLKSLYDLCLPYYQKLYAYRLKEPTKK
ncbi:MAG: sulfotransferase family protein [Oscillatoria sp. SIO1A7]|nr:sulfotransferase family protein [Oscillatoria sp. SIO1A7]